MMKSRSQNQLKMVQMEAYDGIKTVRECGAGEAWFPANLGKICRQQERRHLDEFNGTLLVIVWVKEQFWSLHFLYDDNSPCSRV